MSICRFTLSTPLFYLCYAAQRYAVLFSAQLFCWSYSAWRYAVFYPSFCYGSMLLGGMPFFVVYHFLLALWHFFRNCAIFKLVLCHFFWCYDSFLPVSSTIPVWTLFITHGELWLCVSLLMCSTTFNKTNKKP